MSNDFDIYEEFTEDEVHEAMASFRSQQRFRAALVAGFVASIAGAFVWVGMTLATHTIAWWTAAMVGALIGVSIRYAGRGIDARFGVVGALLCLVSCLVGHYLSLVAIIANAIEMPFFTLLSELGVSAFPTTMLNGFEAVDLLIYPSGMIAAFTISLRKMSREAILLQLAKRGDDESDHHAEHLHDPAFAASDELNM